MDEQGLGSGPLEDVALLAGGTQNVLLGITRAGRRYVLRRPPEHLRANSNETMRREARVLGAIADTGVPHPRLIASCPETDGARRLLLSDGARAGLQPDAPEPHASSTEMRHAMGLALVDGIAALGRVDYEAVGLRDFGRPDGYLERQVGRWRSQLDGYSELEGYPGPEIPGVERVGV